MPAISTYEKGLNPEKALIWRIVHRDNVPWILDNGLHCGSSAVRSPSWVDIGKATLITARASQPVQAEALIHRSLPVEALLGMICHNETVCADIEKLLSPRSLDLKVYARPEWYFS